MSWVVWGKTVAAAFSDPATVYVGALDEDFNDGHIAAGRVEVSGFAACPDGWCLAPLSHGTLTYAAALPKTATSLHVFVWFNLPPGGGNSIGVSTDGGRIFATLRQDRTLVASPFIVPIADRAADLVVKFEARNPTERQILVVDKLTIRGMLSSSNAAVTAQDLGPSKPGRLSLFAALMCFGCAVLPLVRHRWTALAIVVIIACGTVLRAEMLAQAAGRLLDPDAQIYRHFAEQMKPFTDSGFFSGRFGQREPLFILILRLFLHTFGDTPYQVRMMTVLFSIVVIVAGFWTATHLFGRVAGLIVAALLAVNDILIVESSRGLRLELEMLLFLVYLLLAFGRWQRSMMMKAVVLGLLGGIMSLLRSTYLPAAVVLTALAFWPSTRNARQFVLASLVAATLAVTAIVPHRYGLYRTTGDPFFDTALYARWNANIEFAGQPGFPTWRELQADAYIGRPLTYGQYLFGLHSVREVIVGTVRGYAKMFLRMDLLSEHRLVNVLFQLVALAGFVLALGHRRLWWIPVAFVIIEFPVAFLYDRRLVEAYRHSYSGFPLVLFGAIIGLTPLARTVRRWIRALYNPRAHTSAAVAD